MTVVKMQNINVYMEIEDIVTFFFVVKSYLLKKYLFIIRHFRRWI